MNKTTVFITFAILAALGLAGGGLLLIVNEAVYDRFTTFFLTVLGLVTVAAGTFSALNTQDKKLEVVRKQTNGTLTGLLRTIEDKNATIAEKEARIIELEQEKS